MGFGTILFAGSAIVIDWIQQLTLSCPSWATDYKVSVEAQFVTKYLALIHGMIVVICIAGTNLIWSFVSLSASSGLWVNTMNNGASIIDLDLMHDLTSYPSIVLMIRSLRKNWVSFSYIAICVAIILSVGNSLLMGSSLNQDTVTKELNITVPLGGLTGFAPEVPYVPSGPVPEGVSLTRIIYEAWIREITTQPKFEAPGLLADRNKLSQVHGISMLVNNISTQLNCDIDQSIANFSLIDATDQVINVETYENQYEVRNQPKLGIWFDNLTISVNKSSAYLSFLAVNGSIEGGSDIPLNTFKNSGIMRMSYLTCKVTTLVNVVQITFVENRTQIQEPESLNLFEQCSNCVNNLQLNSSYGDIGANKILGWIATVPVWMASSVLGSVPMFTMKDMTEVMFAGWYTAIPPEEGETYSMQNLTNFFNWGVNSMTLGIAGIEASNQTLHAVGKVNKIVGTIPRLHWTLCFISVILWIITTISVYQYAMQIPGLKTFKPLSILASSRSPDLDGIFKGMHGYSDSIIKRRINKDDTRLSYGINGTLGSYKI
ncbi:hypothetical protein RclHR1_02820006 [Rhizophagus clarus]|uniref:Uncharacterized protein n=1 Tax=Rhizophagus clarus TaxID=94130 RepID=A0A2Z6R338_9GLOM|nr:hypothetical protein RclHR1_02820006 [Rhizophagus clarus]GET01043.1 hypothetical protein BKCO1_4000245 [Rhizophagus clarus]